MIKLNLSPVRSDTAQPVVSWAAPVLTVDATLYDLSLLEDGATAEHPILGTVHRIGDDYECTLALPHGANAPHATRFPVPLEITKDGDVALPLYDQTVVEVPNELA